MSEPPASLPSSAVKQYWQQRFHADAGNAWLQDACGFAGEARAVTSELRFSALTGFRSRLTRMNSIAVAAVVLGCTVLGACAGLLLHARLPDQHLNPDSKDVVKLVMGLIATVAALVLGLLISSAHRSYDEQQAEMQQLGVNLFQLDRALERFGPDARDARNLLHRIVASEIEYGSSNDDPTVATDKPLQAQKEAAELFDRVANLSPKTDAQRFMQSQALRLVAGLADIRLLLSEQARGSISWPFLVVLVFWLTVLFVGFGILAPRISTVVAALFLGAISVAGAIFLILELNRPYGGVMKISIVPIRNALIQMTQ